LTHGFSVGSGPVWRVISSNVGILAEVAVGGGAVDRFGKIDSEVGYPPRSPPERVYDAARRSVTGRVVVVGLEAAGI
jgi:hypothetical protein